MSRPRSISVLREEIRGATLIEYIILVGTIPLVALAAMSGFGHSVFNTAVSDADCLASLDGRCAGAGSARASAAVGDSSRSRAASDATSTTSAGSAMLRGTGDFVVGVASEVWNSVKALGELAYSLHPVGAAALAVTGRPNKAVQIAEGVGTLAMHPTRVRDLARSERDRWAHDWHENKSRTAGAAVAEVALFAVPFLKGANLGRKAAAITEEVGASERTVEAAEGAKSVVAVGEPVAAAEAVSQEALKAAVASKAPYEFIKDAPTMGYRIKAGDSLDSLPPVIRKNLGAVDATQYTSDYFQQNADSIIALQWNKGKPDFYVIGKDTFESKYQSVPSSEVASKNPKLFDGLNSDPEVRALVNSGDERIVGALKTTPVRMVKMSDAGFRVEEPATIQSPWGDVQTKPAGQDAFVVLDGDQVYMVNVGPDGNPISYIPRKHP